jgi:uncharacterized membrane protein YfhO
MSIPYQKGWTAYVDGQETELLRANYMYMALPIEAGEHTIELKFEIPGVFTALWIMAGSAGMFVILCIADAIRKGIKKLGKRESGNGKSGKRKFGKRKNQAEEEV